MLETISSLLGSTVGIFYATLFFGGSIFVHELGHFLAARMRGLKVERFSIGFGPRLFGWTGKDGVDYRVSLLPLGGYVSLPQLADPTGIEGEAQPDAAERLPEPSYTDKVVVLSAGVIFNVIFAFLLACVLWGTGRPVPPNSTTTVIGYVAAESAAGKPSPAAAAGLRPGDEILAIDGGKVSDFTQVIHGILLGGGRDADNNPKVTLRIRRDGSEMDITAKPEVRNPTGDRARVIGISPAGQVIVSAEPFAGFPAAAAGLKQGDALLALNGEKLWSFEHFESLLARHAAPAAAGEPLRQVTLRVRATNGAERDARVTPVLRARTADLVKISYKDKETPRELTLVAVPKDALAKKAPAAAAPREALMLYSLGNTAKDAALADVLQPGMLLASVEQKKDFKAVRTAADITTVPPADSVALVFAEEGGAEKTVTLDGFRARLEPARKKPFIGADFATKAILVHQNPVEQLQSVFRSVSDTLGALLNRNSDVGPNQLMGAISIARIYLGTDNILQLIWFTIMINISLAVLNILPVPILDGGHILFATIQKLRGKALGAGLYSGIHYVAIILLFLGMGYVLFNDVKRCSGDNTDATRALIHERYILADLTAPISSEPAAAESPAAAPTSDAAAAATPDAPNNAKSPAR